jgi:hypothetical protein
MFINSNQLKLDGFYFSKKNKNISVTYLWQDGSFCNIGYETDLENNCFQIESERKLPWFWGFFDIVGTELKIQRVNPVSIQQNRRYQIDNYQGVILNDTTFVINKYIDYRNKVNIENDTFRFRYCLNKPDSMNVILENI